MSDRKYTCPACDVLMKSHSVGGRQAWKCSHCLGLAIAVPVVRRALEAAAFRTMWGELLSGPAQAGRPCPGCRNAFREVAVEGFESRMLIDVCRSCQLLWFDPSEFCGLPKASEQESGDAELPAEVRLELAKMKVRALQQRADMESAVHSASAAWPPDLGALLLSLWDC